MYTVRRKFDPNTRIHHCHVVLAHIINPGHSSQELETNYRTEYKLPLQSSINRDIDYITNMHS